MKKILLILACLLIFTGCENAKMNSGVNNQEDTLDSSIYDSEYYEIITMDKFKELYASENPTLIYMGASWCPNCETFKYYAKKFAKENEIKVYFVQTDASNFTEENKTELYSIVQFDYIPYITVYKNKEMLYGDSGVLTDSQLLELANEYGVTK